MNVGAVSASSYSPQLDQVQSAKATVAAAAADRDHDGDTDKIGQADTNDRQQGSIGVFLDTKA
jgi:hypothetical protein